ncbi:type II toxin-antitoxin system CcdA family antitoxin [Thalassospira sp.]|uniref:type II toxin-antitoxin system CcdA family antitoxin n=1 Tax=Thalassospira sp. TaxID=1912094 RepID=UPI003AA871EA
MVCSAKTSGKSTITSLEIDLLNETVAKKRAERWRHQNKPVLDASNSYVDRHGIPLASHRKF